MPPPHLATLCAHAGARRDRGAPFVPPIAQSTLFHLGTADEADRLFSGKDAGYSYTRFGNPTVDALGAALASLEGGGEALVTSSGNAATLAALVMALPGPGAKIVVPADTYGGTLEIMRVLAQKFGADVARVGAGDDWLAAVAGAAVVYAETPTNPLLRLVDLQATVAAAHAAGAKVVIDNTVATPANQRPLDFGADFVVHSLSKYLNGHSDMIGGCVVARERFSVDERSVHKNLGGTVNAMDAWLMLRGLRTFALRMEAHNRNGAAVAAWLANHPAVAQVHYPGLVADAIFERQMSAGGALLSFELRGGKPAAQAFLDKLQLVVHAVSLGGMESLATLPAATSHRGMSAAEREAAGVTDGLVRLSVGVEHLDDLIADLAQALNL